jgi:tripartite-type tricarboxylate transporter receptor subunit TctC
MAEAGHKGISVQPFAAIFGPAKLPPEVIERLARDVGTVMARPEVRDVLARHAFEARGSTPQELADFHREQFDIWRRTLRDVGITPD